MPLLPPLGLHNGLYATKSPYAVPPPWQTLALAYLVCTIVFSFDAGRLFWRPGRHQGL